MAARRTGLELPLPLQFLAAWLAVWLGRVLQEQVDYLKAENHLLREKLGPKRVVLTDAERRRLATSTGSRKVRTAAVTSPSVDQASSSTRAIAVYGLVHDGGGVGTVAG